MDQSYMSGIHPNARALQPSDDRLMLNPYMCGGDMAGGLIPKDCPVAKQDSDDGPAAAFRPNVSSSSAYRFWPYGQVYYDYVAGASMSL